MFTLRTLVTDKNPDEYRSMEHRPACGPGVESEQNPLGGGNVQDVGAQVDSQLEDRVEADGCKTQRGRGKKALHGHNRSCPLWPALPPPGGRTAST